MIGLVRATELIGRPVVTLDTAEDPAEIKDVAFDANGSNVLGFVLRGRGLLGSPHAGYLSIDDVEAVGNAAIMIRNREQIADHDPVLEQATAERREVLGDAVLTDGGTWIGTVVDVILDFGDRRADVAGYEVETGEGDRALVPVPDTFSVSGEALVVPASVDAYVARDLAAFGDRVARFRAGRGREGG